jgi:glutamyl-tRNA synthetase
MSVENPYNSKNEHMPSEEVKKEIITAVFPEELKSPEELELIYPPRELPDGAEVTRIAPSPTGFMHIGHLYTGLISERIAHQSGGIFYLRFEDTDKKREVEGSKELAVKSLNDFGIINDEGLDEEGLESGSYGPYTQSERMDIYHSYIKKLLEEDKAYLCFCTIEELEEMRLNQEESKVPPGYYGKWAKWRDKNSSEVVKEINEGGKFVVRFKSPGEPEGRIDIEDRILGSRDLPENNQDVVIMKTDGLPTYHLAHVVDDHLMRTTTVIRGDEWLSSLPLHLQLFDALNWERPQYAHVAPIQKIEGSSRRKLSKRKDPEANVAYFREQGYLKEAIAEYLLNLANSNFEDWKKINNTKDYREFTLSFEKLKSSTGALFDFDKLNDISKDLISKFTADEVYENVVSWAKDNDSDLALQLEKDPDYARKIFSIERTHDDKTRKDIKKWSDVRGEIEYFYDENFKLSESEILDNVSNILIVEAKEIVSEFIASYSSSDTKEEWFEKIKIIATVHGFATSTSEFKKNPAAFKGSVSEMVKIFRILLTGKTQTPDLHAVMLAMGEDRVARRLALI